MHVGYPSLDEKAPGAACVRCVCVRAAAGGNGNGTPKRKEDEKENNSLFSLGTSGAGREGEGTKD